MGQKRRFRRVQERNGNVIHLALPSKETAHHEVVERLIMEVVAELRKRNAQIDGMAVLTALCRLVANGAVLIGVPDQELLDAIQVHLDREREAQSGGPGHAG